MVVTMCDRCHKKIAAREQENTISALPGIVHDEDHSQREYYIVKKCAAKVNEPISRNIAMSDESALDLCDDCYADFVKFVERWLD